MPRSLNTIILVGVLVCITSALRIAPPKRCTNGFTGTCKPGGKCREGSYCSSIGVGSRRLCCRTKPRPGVHCPFGSTGSCGGKKGLSCKSDSRCKLPVGLVDGLGKCCRLKPAPPKKLCPWGSTGKCTRTNKKCDKGSSCRFPLLPIERKPSPFGECCRNRPVIKPPVKLCIWGSTGKCTRLNKQCDKGSSCRFPLLPINGKPSPFGECCRTRPVPNLPVCRWGSAGRCGSKGKCPRGSSCRYGLDGNGYCCQERPIIKPPIDNVCKHGSTGVCGKGLPKCRKGSTCRMPKPLIPGRPSPLGRCCRDKPIIVPPKNREEKVCPPSSGLPGPCVVRPDNCFDDKQCGKDELCCSEGCGRVCKKAVTRPILKVCPPSSGLLGPCVVGPDNCFDDKQCGKDELCCSEGCGRVCKKAVTPPILKLPTA